MSEQEAEAGEVQVLSANGERKVTLDAGTEFRSIFGEAVFGIVVSPSRLFYSADLVIFGAHYQALHLH
jgi:hypothetical protein